MSGILDRPDIAGRLNALMDVLCPADWPVRRRAAARASLEALAVMACQAGAAGASISLSRQTSEATFEICANLCRALEPGDLSALTPAQAFGHAQDLTIAVIRTLQQSSQPGGPDARRSTPE